MNTKIILGNELAGVKAPHRPHAALVQQLACFLDHRRIPAQHDPRLFRIQGQAGRLFRPLGFLPPLQVFSLLRNAESLMRLEELALRHAAS